MIVLSEPYRKVIVEQRSPEWYKFRQWKIGGSAASTIMGENPYQTIGQLYDQIVSGESIPINEDMRRGIDLEEEALLLLNTKITADFKPCCFESLEYPWAIASADGWSDALECGVELKAPRKFTREMSKFKMPPSKYKGQVQHCMMVCACDKWYYAEYVNGILEYVICKRDDEYIASLIQAEREFHERLMTFSKPEHIYESDWSKFS